MKIYTIEMTCDACGGPGDASLRTSSYAWVGPIVHTDPSVCRYYIEKRQREEKKRQAELTSAMNSIGG